MILPSEFVFFKYGLKVRFVNENDAAFILRLRTDAKLGKYLHETSNDIENQKEWIRDYKKRERKGSDYYFIYLKDDKPLGVNRIYAIGDDRFATGSWVFDPTAPYESAIASALIVRIVGFELLGKKIEYGVHGCHVDNKKVIKFNQMLGLKIRETRKEEMGVFFQFHMTKKDFYKQKPKLEKLIGY